MNFKEVKKSTLFKFDRRGPIFYFDLTICGKSLKFKAIKDNYMAFSVFFMSNLMRVCKISIIVYPSTSTENFFGKNI